MGKTYLRFGGVLYETEGNEDSDMARGESDSHLARRERRERPGREGQRVTQSKEVGGGEGSFGGQTRQWRGWARLRMLMLLWVDPAAGVGLSTGRQLGVLGVTVWYI